MTLPMPLLLIGLALAVLAVIALWRVLLTAAGFGLAQWLVVTAAADNPAVQVLAFGVPALIAAVAWNYFKPSRPVFAGGRSRTREEDVR